MARADENRDNPARLDDDVLDSRLPEPGFETEPNDIVRVSDRTNVHDEGSDANDTPDGLTETEEAVRQAAEDIPTGASPTGSTESVPVFDRGSLPPKI